MTFVGFLTKGLYDPRILMQIANYADITEYMSYYEEWNGDPPIKKCDIIMATALLAVSKKMAQVFA